MDRDFDRIVERLMAFQAKNRKRRAVDKRCGLRALLVFTAVIAGPCAWIAYNAYIVRQRFNVLSLFESTDSCLHAANGLVRGQSPPTISAIRRMLGDQPVPIIFYTASLDDAEETHLKEARQVFPEAAFFEWPAGEPCPKYADPSELVPPPVRVWR